MAKLEFRRLSPTFGALVTGVNLSSDIATKMQSALRQALLDYQVLVFRNQNLTEDRQVSFAQIFGPCRTPFQSSNYPSENELTHYLSNVNQDGSPTHQHPDPDSAYWHIDGSWSRNPYKATVLYAIQVPKGHGNTQYANLYQAYNDLDQRTKNRLSKLKAEHNINLSRAARHRRTPQEWWRSNGDREPLPVVLRWWSRVLINRLSRGIVTHPVIRIHAETGRPTLFAGDHAWRITGRFWPTGTKLVREINDLGIESPAIYTHSWEAGDLLIWDNQSILHRSGTYDISRHVRIIRRCVVAN